MNNIINNFSEGLLILSPYIGYMIIASTIVIALQTKETLEKRIINVVMIIILPIIGSLIFIGKLIISKRKRNKNEK